MIVYPTSENRTLLRFPPWLTYGLLALSTAGFLGIYLPAKGQHSQSQLESQEAIRQELYKQHEAGTISEAFFIRAHEDLSVIGNPEFSANYTDSVRDLYKASTTIPHPIETWYLRDTTQHFIYALIPHHWSLLLLAFLCLPALGYIFEHLYDRLVYAGLISLIAPCWVVLSPHIKSSFWPNPIFSWSMTMATVLAAMYVTAPRAIVTLTFRTWFLKGFEARIHLPTLIFPALFYCGVTLINMQFPEFQRHFSAEQLASAALLGGIIGLFVLVLPSRNQQFDGNPETQINQQLARAEVYFTNQQKEKAISLLQELLDLGPTLQQTRRIANLAWEHHQTELADRAFKSALRKTLQNDDHSLAFQIVETMVFHNLQVPDSVLLKTAEFGIKNGKVETVRKMIPYIQDQPGLNIKDISQLQERLVTALFDRPDPNRTELYEIKQWFEANDPQSGALAKIDHFLSQFSSEAGLLSNYAPKSNVHKHLPVTLTTITSNQILFRTGSDSEKTVPWTAVLGGFGCLLDQDSGFMGALFIQFKRKLFACTFTHRDILIKDDTGKLISFANAWRELEKLKGPLPFTSLEDFETIRDAARFPEAAERFVKDFLP